MGNTYEIRRIYEKVMDGVKGKDNPSIREMRTRIISGCIVPDMDLEESRVTWICYGNGIRYWEEEWSLEWIKKERGWGGYSNKEMLLLRHGSEIYRVEGMKRNPKKGGKRMGKKYVLLKINKIKAYNYMNLREGGGGTLEDIWGIGEGRIWGPREKVMVNMDKYRRPNVDRGLRLRIPSRKRNVRDIEIGENSENEGSGSEREETEEGYIDEIAVEEEAMYRDEWRSALAMELDQQGIIKDLINIIKQYTNGNDFGQAITGGAPIESPRFRSPTSEIDPSAGRSDDSESDKEEYDNESIE
jgi:hypothetical protein